jgi:putative transposase
LFSGLLLFLAVHRVHLESIRGWNATMTEGLKRFQEAGDLHFVTFSCYQRRAYLAPPPPRCRFEEVLERFRERYAFCVIGYVVMPEHVHLLVSEPAEELLAKALHAMKLSMAKLSKERPFWQARYYDFNVFSSAKRVEKLKYIHRNPVKRGLVDKPEDWSGRVFDIMRLGSVEERRLNRFGRWRSGRGLGRKQ